MSETAAHRAAVPRDWRTEGISEGKMVIFMLFCFFCWSTQSRVAHDCASRSEVWQNSKGQRNHQSITKTALGKIIFEKGLMLVVMICLSNILVSQLMLNGLLHESRKSRACDLGVLISSSPLSKRKHQIGSGELGVTAWTSLIFRVELLCKNRTQGLLLYSSYSASSICKHFF